MFSFLSILGCARWFGGFASLCITFSISPWIVVVVVVVVIAFVCGGGGGVVGVVVVGVVALNPSGLLGLQSRYGDKPL